METSQFEGCKVALKQDKTGYILTLSIHPNDLPEAVLRDFVGARYQVVMVRINEHEQPMNRKQELPDATQKAAIMCRDSTFSEYLLDIGEIFEGGQEEVTNWMKETFKIASRTELRTNEVARAKFMKYNEDFLKWRQLKSV
jgi:hypothetical protein